MNRAGWVAEGLLAALFVGLILFVILFSYFSTSAIFTAYLKWGYIIMAAVIVAAMFATYWCVAVYRKRRFRKGGQDFLMMRNLMTTCLDNDCSAVEQQFSAADGSDLSIFNRMLLCKLQEIFERERTRVIDIHTRFRKSGIKEIKGVHFEKFFQTSESYDTTPEPLEIKTAALALKPLGSGMEASLVRLKNSRRLLFTAMSDYLDLLSVTDADVKKLLKAYRFNPPGNETARDIVFANNAVDYLIKFHRNRLSDERRFAMEAIASQKLLQLKSVLSDYRKAWRHLVDTYESISLGRKPLQEKSEDAS